MSPTRPRIGVKIDADSRYPVSTQVTVSCDVCRLRWMVGSAGRTSDCSSPNAATPLESTARVTWREEPPLVDAAAVVRSTA
jgi:hypothetical protein